MLCFLTMIGIDTFSWYKLIYLYNNDWKNLIEELLKKGDFFITHEVKKELEYRFPNYNFLLEYITILPKLKGPFLKYLERGFDEADSSLLAYAEEKKSAIITEDHPMIAEGITEKQNIFQLAHYFGILMKVGFITPNEFYKLMKLLRKMRNISKKKGKELDKLRIRES